MPRRAGSSSDKGPIAEFKSVLGLDEGPSVMNGYEVESVCLPCLSMLQGLFPIQLDEFMNQTPGSKLELI